MRSFSAIWIFSCIYFFLRGPACPPSIVASLISGGWRALRRRRPNRSPTRPPPPRPPLPHSPRKQVAQPGVDTLHLAAFSRWWSKKWRRRGDSALMTAEVSACSAASLSRSEEHEEGDERRPPSAPAGLPGPPQLHPG